MQRLRKPYIRYEIRGLCKPYISFALSALPLLGLNSLC